MQMVELIDEAARAAGQGAAEFMRGDAKPHESDKKISAVFSLVEPATRIKVIRPPASKHLQSVRVIAAPGTSWRTKRITPANSCSRISVGKWNWKPREVSRAIDVIRKAGLAVTGVTISKEGAITVTTGASGTASGQSANPWDTHHAANQERPS